LAVVKLYFFSYLKATYADGSLSGSVATLLITELAWMYVLYSVPSNQQVLTSGEALLSCKRT